MRRLRPVWAVLIAGLLAGCHRSSQHTAPPMPGTDPSMPQDKAIAAVLSSPEGEGFGFFLNHAGHQRCAIPEGGHIPGGLVNGECTTRVFPRPGYSGQTVVVFTETWPWRAFHYAGQVRRPQTHSWRFVVRPSGQVAKRVEQSGDFPPQFIK